MNKLITLLIVQGAVIKYFQIMSFKPEKVPRVVVLN